MAFFRFLPKYLQESPEELTCGQELCYPEAGALRAKRCPYMPQQGTKSWAASQHRTSLQSITPEVQLFGIFSPGLSLNHLTEKYNNLFKKPQKVNRKRSSRTIRTRDRQNRVVAEDG